MAPTFRASASSGIGASPRTVNKPTGTLEGDRLILHVSTVEDVTPVAPEGFELIAGSEITGAASIRLYQKLAGDSEPASYEVTWPSGNGNIAMSAYVGAADPVSVHQIEDATGGSSTDRVWPSVTNTEENTLLCCFGSMTVSNATTPDAACTERYDVIGTNCRLYLMTESVAATGATGTRTGTGASATVLKAVTISLVEAAAEPELTAPTDLVAVADGASSILLTWESADDPEDFDAFHIERSPNGEDTWSEIDTVASDVYGYLDTGLTAATEYFYRVRGGIA